MSSALYRLAAGAVLAIALSGAASAADANLKPKASTTADMTGKCLAATTVFAKFTEGDAKEGDDKSMTELAVTWLTFLEGKPEAYQSAALEGMKATAEGYSKAVERSGDEGMAALAGDMATCILEME